MRREKNYQIDICSVFSYIVCCCFSYSSEFDYPMCIYDTKTMYMSVCISYIFFYLLDLSLSFSVPFMVTAFFSFTQFSMLFCWLAAVAADAVVIVVVVVVVTVAAVI